MHSSFGLRISGVTTALVLWAVALAPAEARDEWSQWRGTHRDGHASMFQVPSTWPELPQEVWKIEVGEGFASPIVSGGAVYLMTRQGDEEVAMALSVKEGKLRWAKRFPAPYEMHQAAVKYGKGPKSTPVVADGVVCFLGIDARFSCHQTEDGKVLWTRDYSDKSAPEETFCGSSMSPLVVDGTVYVHLGDDRAGRFIAADLRTGEEKWGWEGQGPGYASPLWIEIEGQPQVVAFATTDLLGFEPKTGELLWKRYYPDKWRENIVDPLVVGERILISDYENGTLSLWPKKTEKGWVVEDHWHNKELTQRMASPVTDGKLVFGFSNRRKGQLFALDPQTGKVLWEEEGRGGSNAVLTVVGDWLLVANTAAELRVMRWQDQAMEEVERYQIASSEVWAQPAWLPDGLLVKDKRHLTRFMLVAPPKPPEPLTK
ncbi:MAG: PQQ-binding-like beta-propeller repeat protein [Acidobacteriota bacterium]